MGIWVVVAAVLLTFLVLTYDPVPPKWAKDEPSSEAILGAVILMLALAVGLLLATILLAAVRLV
jgi:multisubunit Na+/H+ antiporter MnhB subunit